RGQLSGECPVPCRGPCRGRRRRALPGTGRRSGIHPCAARSAPHRRPGCAASTGETGPAAHGLCLLPSRQSRPRPGDSGNRAWFFAAQRRYCRHVSAYQPRGIGRDTRWPATNQERQEGSMTLGPLMSDVAGHTLTTEDQEVLRHPLVGSVILFTRNYADPEQLAALVAAIRQVRSPPLLVAVDHEGGRVQRFRAGFSVLPPMRRTGQEYDLDAQQGLAMARALNWLMAAEPRAVGIAFSFAPCVDLDYGVSAIIGDRAFHSDADIVAKLALAAMAGMRDAGMAATAKHFPGHGAVVADSHLALPVDRRELADLSADMLPYRRL